MGFRNSGHSSRTPPTTRNTPLPETRNTAPRPRRRHCVSCSAFGPPEIRREVGGFLHCFGLRERHAVAQSQSSRTLVPYRVLGVEEDVLFQELLHEFPHQRGSPFCSCEQGCLAEPIWLLGTLFLGLFFREFAEHLFGRKRTGFQEDFGCCFRLLNPLKSKPVLCS